ncbi:hypothetical protein [Pseudomonas sp. RIT-PI-S]|nr:hypothetical protein [Pseudomonas sp. RIT-PI-S]
MEYVGFQGLRMLPFEGADCKASDRKPLVGTPGRDYHARLRYRLGKGF